jgi:hypothetical protein
MIMRVGAVIMLMIVVMVIVAMFMIVVVMPLMRAVIVVSVRQRLPCRRVLMPVVVAVVTRTHSAVRRQLTLLLMRMRTRRAVRRMRTVIMAWNRNVTAARHGGAPERCMLPVNTLK